MEQHFLEQDFAPCFEGQTLPRLVHVRDNNGSDAWHRPLHMHSNLTEIYFVREGSGDFIIGDKTYAVKKGNILIYNKETLHDERSNPDYPLKSYACGVTNLHVPGLEENCLIGPNVSPVLKSGNYFATLESLFEFMVQEATASPAAGPTAQFLLCAILSIILRLVADNSDLNTADAKSLGHRIKQFIDENYTRDIKLKDIADHLYISPYYLAHVFKKETGFSPVQYIINRRIGEAQTLLLHTNFSVTKIAKQVGYENANYFNILFKKNTGVSPGKFRQIAAAQMQEGKKE